MLLLLVGACGRAGPTTAAPTPTPDPCARKLDDVPPASGISQEAALAAAAKGPPRVTTQPPTCVVVAHMSEFESPGSHVPGDDRWTWVIIFRKDVPVCEGAGPPPPPGSTPAPTPTGPVPLKETYFVDYLTGQLVVTETDCGIMPTPRQ